jgi:hypothetical protein
MLRRTRNVSSRYPRASRVRNFYGFFFDWDMAEPANDFVTALEVPDFNAVEAFVSTDLLVCLLVDDWDRTLPARVFCTADELGLLRVLEAKVAALFPLCLLVAIVPLRMRCLKLF